MDDIFAYLIYAIIIISFLSSFLKKKEPAKQIPLPKNNESGNKDELQSYTAAKEAGSTQGKSDNFDILKELEKVFNSDFKIPEQQKPKQVDPYDIYQSSEIKDKNLDLVVDPRMLRNVEDKSPIGTCATYSDGTTSLRKNIYDRQRQPKILDSDIRPGKNEFELVLAGPRKQRETISNFNRKLKDPRTIKEYILFSEILGKPKALRR